MFKKKNKKDILDNSSSDKEKVKSKETEKIDLEEDNEEYWQIKKDSLKDILAPDYVDFNVSENYFKINDGVGMTLYIGLMPNSVDFPVFLDKLYGFGNIDVSVFITPVSNETSIKTLSKMRNDALVELETAVGVNRQDDVAAKEYEAARLRQEISSGNNKLYDAAIICNLYAKTKEELDNLVAKLKNDLAIKDIGLKNAVCLQEEGFASNLPFNNNKINDIYKPFDKRSLATVFPFTVNNINHADGVIIGKNRDNGLPVKFNNFSEDLNNYNMIIFAPSGAGKSTFNKAYSSRNASICDVVHFSLDIEGEYNDIAETLGGVTIKLSSDIPCGINFFDVSESFNTKTREYYIDMSSQITQVSGIVATLAKGITGNNQEYYNDILISIITDGVKEFYKEYNLTSDPESLYENQEMTVDEKGNIIGGKVKKKFKTLSHYYSLIEKARENNKIETKVKYYDYLLSVLSQYVRCKNGNFICFDSESELKISKENLYTNFDVSQLDENTQFPIAMHIICNYLWETVIKNNKDGTKIRVILEEAWKSLKVIDNKPVYPEIVSFVEKLSRRARKRNTSLVLVTQEHKDVNNPVTEPIFNNCDIKVILPAKKEQLQELKESFKLTDGEYSYISKMPKRHALFKANNISLKLHIDVPDYEMKFIETNQNKLFASQQ